MTAVRHWKRLLVVLVLTGLTVCWVFATPLFGLSDEPAQVMRAASTVRGQVVGTPAGGPNTIVSIPEDLIGANRLPCFMFHPTISAGCEAPLGHDTADVSEETWVGYYPPLYYFLVGWPSLLFQGAVAVYAMRLVAALLCSVLLAFAFFSAADARGRALLLPAVAALATPYVFVYMATVNPSGMEMTSALCAWTSGVALANGPPSANKRRILARFVISMAVLAQVRDLGPLFAGVLVVVLVAWYGVRASWHLLRRRRVQLMVAGVGVCAAFAGVWVLTVGNLTFVANALPSRTGDFMLVWRSIQRFWHDLIQLPGNFGWTDTSPPRWVTAIGLLAIGGLLVLGLRAAARRERRIGIALLSFSFVFPVLLVAAEARTNGVLGQGRYWFPLIIGGLLLVAEAGGSRAARPSLSVWSGVAVIGIVVDVVCFQVALDRFRFGLGRPEITAGWNPPGGGDLWPVLYGALTLAFTYWWWSLGRPHGADARDPSRTARVAMRRLAAPVAWSAAGNGTSVAKPPVASSVAAGDPDGARADGARTDGAGVNGGGADGAGVNGAGADGGGADGAGADGAGVDQAGVERVGADPVGIEGPAPPPG